MTGVLSDGRERKLATNQALFREVNERIESLAPRHDRGQRWQIEVVCECSDERCAALIAISLVEYEQVRASGARFLVYPGHDIPEIETVVARNGGYDVVEKRGRAAMVAQELDPRTRAQPA